MDPISGMFLTLASGLVILSIIKRRYSDMLCALYFLATSVVTTMVFYRMGSQASHVLMLPMHVVGFVLMVILSICFSRWLTLVLMATYLVSIGADWMYWAGVTMGDLSWRRVHIYEVSQNVLFGLRLLLLFGGWVIDAFAGDYGSDFRRSLGRRLSVVFDFFMDGSEEA